MYFGRHPQPAPAPAPTCYLIELIEDTRSFDVETGKAIPGTGEARSCDFCGAAHEIWVHVHNPSTGDRKICGSSCAKGHAYDQRNALKHAGRALPRRLVQMAEWRGRGRRMFWMVALQTTRGEVLDHWSAPASLTEDEARTDYLEYAAKLGLAIRWAAGTRETGA